MANAAPRRRQTRADPGFDARHVVVASIELRLAPHAHADPVAPGIGVATAPAALREAALARVGALPRAERVATAHGAPLYHGLHDEVRVPGHVYAPDESPKMSLQTAGPGYFATIGSRVVSGREFGTDEHGDPLHPRGTFDAVIVNEAMARIYWPGADPIGKRVSFRNTGMATVIGVVRDMRDVSAMRPIPRAYFPALEWFSPRFEILVRTRDPEAMLPRVRAALSGLPGADPPVVQTLGEIVGDATLVARVAELTLTVCAGVALLLTAIGLYGLVAMWANDRRREIGIRLALGATAAHVHRLLLSAVGRALGIGTLVGVAGAALALRLEQSWIEPVMVLEPAPMLAAISVLLLVAGGAALLPSHRATKLAVAEVIRAQ